jgi:hypothetical protein
MIRVRVQVLAACCILLSAPACVVAKPQFVLEAYVLANDCGGCVAKVVQCLGTLDPKRCDVHVYVAAARKREAAMTLKMIAPFIRCSYIALPEMRQRGIRDGNRIRVRSGKEIVLEGCIDDPATRRTLTALLHMDTLCGSAPKAHSTGSHHRLGSIITAPTLRPISTPILGVIPLSS